MIPGGGSHNSVTESEQEFQDAITMLRTQREIDVLPDTLRWNVVMRLLSSTILDTYGTVLKQFGTVSLRADGRRLLKGKHMVKLDDARTIILLHLL